MAGCLPGAVSSPKVPTTQRNLIPVSGNAAYYFINSGITSLGSCAIVSGLFGGGLWEWCGGDVRRMSLPVIVR